MMALHLLRQHTRAIVSSAMVRRSLSFAPAPRRDDKHTGSVLRMLIFGKPGAGKGTLSARLVGKYNIVSISTGDLLRLHIKERTEIGRQASELVARGELLPDELMLQVVSTRLHMLRNQHWILDGFPRTLGQGKLLDAHLKKYDMPLTLVVNLDVSDETILRRISGRWIHPSSGRVYNMSYNPPKVDGLDDETGEPLTRRPDDNPEIFARRLEAFYASTSPLLSYYSAAASAPSIPRADKQHPHQLALHRPHKLRLRTIPGTTSDEIWPKLDILVRNTFPGLKAHALSPDIRGRHSLSDAMAADGLGTL